MSVTATLSTILTVNGVEVAVSNDPVFFQNVLAAFAADRAGGLPVAAAVNPQAPPVAVVPRTEAGPDIMGRFAKELALDTETVWEACSPSTEPPFLKLDEWHWNTFRDHTTRSIPPIIVPATLLLLWFRNANLGNTVTVAQARAVLASAGGERDKNPGRALNNCRWLKSNGENIRLAPSLIGEAIAVARAFCSKSPIHWETPTSLTP